MGREKRTQPGPGATAKDRHKKAGKVSKTIDRSAPLPPGLVAAKPINAITKIKHQSYFEFIENKDKKKPLLFEITTDPSPPPGMVYIPIGNPELTERCKDISRELGASVYIVTYAKRDASELSQQIHRVGHHIREYIVDRAKRELGQDTIVHPATIGPDNIEKIPENQDDIDKQADSALRELFPRIPNTDRQEIINHAFQKGKQFKGELVVGLQQELSLSRRVQLAVLAHIRHNHTRYDKLLRETSWANARRATEQLCLDILVKWRGDDENGRNQLDEILREVVVLSDDSDEEDSGEEPDSESSEILIDRYRNIARVSAPAAPQSIVNTRKRLSTAVPSRPGSPKPLATPGTSKRIARKARKRDKHRERNFSRYEAAANAAWDSAMKRQRQAPNSQMNQPGMADNSVSHGGYPQSQSVAFFEDRAPVIDVGPPHPQMRPAPGAFGNNSYETRPHVDGAFVAQPQPTRSQYFHSGSTMQKVNESSSVPARGPIDQGDARPPHNYQLSDYLHPSIEPGSPDAIRPPSRYSRGVVEYVDRRGDESQHGFNSPLRGPVVREEQRILPRHQIHQSFPVHTRTLPDGQGLVRTPDPSYYSVPQDTARPVPYQSVREYGPARPYGYVDGTQPRESRFAQRHDGVVREKTNSIMIEDQNVRPGTIFLSRGESVRDRFGPDVEILAVRRPRRDGEPRPEPQHAAPMDEGFIRLRESRPREQRNGLEEEGFLRLRERPINTPGNPTHAANGMPLYADYRPTPDSSHRYRSVVAPEQAVYVRRVERPPPVDISYLPSGAERVERVRSERIVQRDLPSPLYSGAPVEYHQHHLGQGAYEVPVYRRSRPEARAEDSVRFDRYPPPPPAQGHWPRTNEDIIVLE
ncbi:hypothetical protein EsH8_II_000990 [Colletotrichum jinshuiense]